MNRKEYFSLAILILVFGFATYRYITREYTEVRSKYILDTIVEISATSQKKAVGQDIEAVFYFIEQLQGKLNEYEDFSLISQINNSDDEVFPMDEDIYNLLVLSDSLYSMSHGAFDATIKPVWDLWGFNNPNPTVPDSLLLIEELKKVDFSRIKYDKTEFHKPKGMKLSFGAIAKGYILDKAIAYMQERGLKSGFINSRSSMCFYGNKVPPIVYIQHPRNEDDSIASFHINDLSVGTSGDYQQFFEVGGKRYHHIIDARTGYPVENVYSVTVISPTATMADGLSTALFLMDPSEALAIVNKMPDTNCVIYYQQDSGIVSLKTEGMKALSFSEKI